VRIPLPPPSSGTEFGRYLTGVAGFLNQLPNFSTFSFASPNSNVTATAPALAVNQSSSGSKLWVKTIGSGNTGWQAIA